MKKTLTTYDIAHELLEDTNAAWTRAGAFAIAEYLEEYEESTGEEIELDVAAIRCDFSEHSSLQMFLEDYHGTALNIALERSDIDISDMDDEDEIDEAIRSFIQDKGQLIEFDGGIIVSSF